MLCTITSGECEVLTSDGSVRLMLAFLALFLHLGRVPPLCSSSPLSCQKPVERASLLHWLTCTMKETFNGAVC